MICKGGTFNVLGTNFCSEDVVGIQYASDFPVSKPSFYTLQVKEMREFFQVMAASDGISLSFSDLLSYHWPGPWSTRKVFLLEQ